MLLRSGQTGWPMNELENGGHCPSPITQVALCGQPIKKPVVPPTFVVCPECVELQEKYGFQWHARPIRF